MTFVSQLKPVELWRHFDRILTIPRGSKNEADMRNYVIEVADKHGLSHRQDAIGNLVVEKPAAKGLEEAPITVLQSHLDMVNDKNADVEHDFAVDPIKPRQEGDFLYATGTTLGSDNGIGVAAQLALMESKTTKHGPLELLFTIDEETGLTGASQLSSDLLHGRQLINLDTEEANSLYVGCAGGAGMNLTLPLMFSSAKQGQTAFVVKLYGLQGGHSGVDIHLQRGNAVKLLVRGLNAARPKIDFNLANLHGGNMHNAIPREAFATLLTQAESGDALRSALEEIFAELYDEFKPADPGMKWEITPAPVPTKSLDTVETERALDLLNALPHGVISMSYDIADLVETSSNLAIVKMEEGELFIHVSNRSSVDSAIHGIQSHVASIGRLADAQLEEVEGYPGWKPNMDSYVLQVAQEVHDRVLGRKAEVKAIHAGLECGIIGTKYPGMDMVSLGPEIRYPHSPNECVDIKSVASFYRLLVALLEELAEDH